MRLLNQMLNLRRIFDCFSCRFDKVVFNLKLSNLVDSDVPSQSSYPWIKLGTRENRRLSWVMITVSSILKIPVDTLWYIQHFLNSCKLCFQFTHYGTLYARTTQVNKRFLKKKKKNKITKNLLQGDSNPDPQSQLQWNPAITKCHGTEKNVRYTGVFVIAKTPL